MQGVLQVVTLLYSVSLPWEKCLKLRPRCVLEPFQVLILAEMLTPSQLCGFPFIKCCVLQLQGFLSPPLVGGLETCTGSI